MPIIEKSVSYEEDDYFYYHKQWLSTFDRGSMRSNL